MSSDWKLWTKFTNESSDEQEHVINAMSGLAGGVTVQYDEERDAYFVFVPNDMQLDATERILNRAKTGEGWEKTQSLEPKSEFL